MSETLRDTKAADDAVLAQQHNAVCDLEGLALKCGAAVYGEQAGQEAQDQVRRARRSEAGLLCGRCEHASQGHIWSTAPCRAAAPVP